MIHVFVADDHAMIRDGLRAVLSEDPRFAFAGAAEDASGVLAAARESRLGDALVLDLSLPGGSGLDVLAALRQLQPDVPVVVYSMYGEDPYGARAIAAGARSYIHKGRPVTELLTALERVAAGRRYITPDIAEILFERGEGAARPPHEQLSEREFQVFLLTVEGTAPAEIARTLHVGRSTISTHLQRIKTKLGVQTKLELVKYAFRNGLVE